MPGLYAGCGSGPGLAHAAPAVAPTVRCLTAWRTSAVIFTRGSLRLRIIRIRRVHIAGAPVGGIVIVPIHIPVIAPLAHIAMDQVRVVGWRTGDVLARLVD